MNSDSTRHPGVATADEELLEFDHPLSDPSIVTMLSANDEPTTGIDPTVVGLSRAPAGKAAFKNHMETRPREGVSSERLQHIWIITGPAGCGKTTVAKGLEKELGLPFLEGDDVSVPSYSCSKRRDFLRLYFLLFSPG